MMRLPLIVLFIFLAGGCNSLTKLKRSDAMSDARPKPAESPMSQLGVALPAMKPGEDRELKIIAAEQMAKHGYWSEAVELYLEAEAMAPKKPRLDAELAPAFAGAGKHTESLQRYRRLVESDPKNALLLNNFAFTLLESGDLVAAETQFRRALAIDSQCENAAVNLGLLLARQRRYDEALSVLTPVIGEAAAHHNLGVVAIDGGDEATAKQQFTIAASLPSTPKATQEFIAAISQP